MAMRRITAEEGARWQKLAAEHGWRIDDRRTVTNRFVVEHIDEENKIVTVRLITPCVAVRTDQDGKPKAPPIMFDRDAEGSIVFPGRWWHERMTQAADTKPRFADIGRNVTFLDIALPPDTDTIAMRHREESG